MQFVKPPLLPRTPGKEPMLTSNFPVTYAKGMTIARAIVKSQRYPVSWTLEAAAAQCNKTLSRTCIRMLRTRSKALRAPSPPAGAVASHAAVEDPDAGHAVEVVEAMEEAADTNLAARTST